MQFYEPERLQFLWLIPLLVLLFWYAEQKKQRLLRVFMQLKHLPLLAPSFSRARLNWKRFLVVSGTAFCVLALAQPQWGEEKKKVSRKGIDLIFLVDTSLSMLAQDVKPSRIEKAKFEMKTFLKHLKGDRIGIVSFAGSGFLQSPLTLDYSAFSLFANSIQVGDVPDPGTNLREGIRLAAQSFPKGKGKHKAIVILSDGENMESEIRDAVEIAKQDNVRIYTIGLGTKNGEPIPLMSETGKISGYKKDRSGNVVVSKLNETLLQEAAQTTGGLYFPATPSERETDLIYQHIQGLGKKELKEQVVVEREDHFQSFLLLAFLCLLCEAILSDRARENRGIVILSKGAA